MSTIFLNENEKIIIQRNKDVIEITGTKNSLNIEFLRGNSKA